MLAFRKCQKNHTKTLPRGLQNRYRLAKGLGTLKITIFMLKTSIFGWPKILDFFQNRVGGGGAWDALGVFVAMLFFSASLGLWGGFWTRFGPDSRQIFCIFGGLGRFLDPIWTRLSTDFLSFRASCSHGSLPLRGLVGMREA